MMMCLHFVSSLKLIIVLNDWQYFSAKVLSTEILPVVEINYQEYKIVPIHMVNIMTAADS